MRLIDADELKSKLQARHDNGTEEFDKGYNIGLGTAIDLIDNAPTVEEKSYAMGYQDGAEDGLQGIRPHGKWIKVPVKRDILYVNGIAYTCSVCNKSNSYGMSPYCMYCGASLERSE